jgi:hypothetical protein
MFWVHYILQNAAETAPLRTKVITSFTILTSADVIRQACFEDHPAAPAERPSPQWAPRGPDWWDTERTARMALFSCTLHPFWIHHWFNFLEHWLPSAPLSAPTSTVLLTAGRKVLIDQFASAATFHAVFLSITTLMQGRSYEDVKIKLHRDWCTHASLLPSTETLPVCRDCSVEMTEISPILSVLLKVHAVQG